MTTTPFTVLASEAHHLEAQAPHRHYRITVSLPLGYNSAPDEGWPFNNLPDQWPTVYVLDGNWYAGMVTDMIRPTRWCGSITDAIVVGVGYPEGTDSVEAFREAFTRRNFDLTPVPDPEEDKRMEQQHNRPAPTGGAPQFSAFLQDTLIPFIERTYRAAPSKRILAGHSYGGLFAAYSLFHMPGLFSTYIIGSPSLDYGEQFVFKQEATFAQSHDELPAHVLLYAGDEEAVNDSTLTDTLRFDALLRSRGYSGLSVEKRLFMDQNHCEVAAPGIQWGLKAALAPSI